jgi:hypothetical protein
MDVGQDRFHLGFIDERGLSGAGQIGRPRPGRR